MRLFIFISLLSSFLMASSQTYEKIDLSTSISIDVNGDGSDENISFTKGECAQIMIQGDSEYLFGCGSKTYFEFPSQLEWVDYWGIFPKQKTEEGILNSNGDLEVRSIVMQNDGIFLMKEEDGLIIIGVLTFMEGKPYWIHQYC
ncbi:MAG: hypothetical protein ABJG47_19795 [Ekhidna sp.]